VNYPSAQDNKKAMMTPAPRPVVQLRRAAWETSDAVVGLVIDKDQLYVENAEDTPTQIQASQLKQGATGIALITRQHFADMSSIRSSRPLAALLPGDSLDATAMLSLGINESAWSVVNLVLHDAVLGRKDCKRCMLVQLGTPAILIQAHAPTLTIKVPETCAFVAEASSKYALQSEVDALREAPRKQLRRMLDETLPEEFRGQYELSAPATYQAGGTQHWQAIFRLPSTSRLAVLETSGSHSIFIRAMLGKNEVEKDLTVVWAPLGLADLRRAAAKLEGVKGLALSQKSIGLRVLVADVAKARELLRPGAYPQGAQDVVPSLRYEAQGLPLGINPGQVVELFSSWPWKILPLRGWTRGNIQFWQLGASTPHPGELLRTDQGAILVQLAAEERVAAKGKGKGRPPRSATCRPASATPARPPAQRPPATPTTASSVPSDSSAGAGHAAAIDRRFEAIEARLTKQELATTSLQSNLHQLSGQLQQADRRQAGIDSKLDQLLQAMGADALPRKRGRDGEAATAAE